MPQKSRAMRLFNQRAWQIFISVFGFLLGICGILSGMFWDQIFANILHKEMILKPGSMVYDKWKNPPVKLSLDIYLYNWTNPEDFRNLSTKPILEQCGPYRFTETPDKVDIAWHPENSSLTYRRKSLFHFDAAGSNGSLDDEITTLNAVALSAAGKTKFWNPVRSKLVDVGLTLYKQHMSVTKTVDELLFTGYSDDMITMARTMSIFGKDVEVPFDRFGWFYTRNGSADLTGTFNVFTGADDASRLGQMHTWNFQPHSGFFESHCGMVNGSGGEFYPPNLTHDSVVGLFTPDMCRTVPLEYTDTVEIEGIKGYKFAGGPRSVDNGTLFPENSCFCGGQCVPSGVMNVSACRFGSPVFMSYPHFYQADPYFINKVEGLEPSKDKHEFYMILEPRTGLALEVAARFQVNMLVEPLESVRYLATGETFASLAFQFRAHRSTISKIVPKCLAAIVKHLLPTAMPPPTTESFTQNIAEFSAKWNYPNCCGAIDGKHVRIKCPPKAGSAFFNYKDFHSIVLLAMVDANYKFTAVDVGSYGREGDAGIYLKSEMGKSIGREQFNIPPPNALPNTETVLPNVILGDEAFALHRNLMKPYPRQQSLHDRCKAIYNYRHSRARRTTENAFGIMASYFRVFHTPIGIATLETIDNVILAACILHNMMRSQKINSPAETIFGNTDDVIMPLNNLIPIAHATVGGRPNNEASIIREKFKDYFNEVGAVVWQDRSI